jgi:orotate phosphoribosyltransferase
MFSESKITLADVLIKMGAVKFGSFRLKLHDKFPDAPLSPIYIDLRLLRSFPDAMKSSVSVYQELAAGLQFDLLADIPTAATPITAVLSYITRIPMISPRMGQKDHGTTLPIDGKYEKRQVVLVVDDLITKADSKLAGISVLEDNGLVVRDLVVLIDREQGGVEALHEKGYACHCAFRLTDLLSYYSQNGMISSDDYLRTLKYLESH